MRELGFRVWPTATNFVMLRAEGELAKQLAQVYYAKYGKNLPEQQASGKLIFKYYLENSILVRDFTGHPVLTGALRISVGLPEENKRILAKLTELCMEARGGKA
jgi:histidinol-phosphate aminotransferase